MVDIVDVDAPGSSSPVNLPVLRLSSCKIKISEVAYARAKPRGFEVDLKRKVVDNADKLTLLLRARFLNRESEVVKEE
jgi:hypothetical protein